MLILLFATIYLLTIHLLLTLAHRTFIAHESSRDAG